LLDDIPLIARNPFVQRPAWWWRLWTGDYWASTGAASGLYRPLPLTTYALTWWFAGGWTPAYHATNMLLHAVCTVLLFLGLLRFASTGTAAVAAAVFALHPVHAEAVANIAGRTELMLGAGLLASLHGVGALGDGRRVAGSVLTLGGTACMVFSKETGLVLSVLVMCLLIRGGLRTSGANRRAAFLAAAAVGAIAATHIAMRLAFAGTRSLLERTPNAWNWLLLSLSAAGKNAQLLLLPWHQQAVWPLPGPEGPPMIFVALGVVTVAAVVLAVAQSDRFGPLTRLSIYVIVFAAVPLLHVLPNVIWVWERGLYVPVMGLAGLVCSALGQVRSPRARQVAACAVALAAGAGGVRAAVMSHLYADDLRFHEYQWRANPNDAGAALSLSESLRRRGRTDEAAELRLGAYALAPVRGPVVMAVSGFLLEAGRTVEAARILESAAAVDLEFHTPEQAAQGYQMLADLADRLGLREASRAFSVRARNQRSFASGAENLP
jgi:tetratricopeptide (TPR) repeat protein